MAADGDDDLPLSGPLNGAQGNGSHVRGSEGAPSAGAADKDEAGEDGKLKQVEVRYQHSANLADLLSQLNCTLLISTYQAGKLVCVGVHEGQISFSFHAFQQVMGMAVSPRRLAIGSRRQVYFLERAEGLGPRIEPAGKFDACYLTRHAHITGPIHIHDLAWGSDELWLVNTLFSCLSTLDGQTSFVPRWKPNFISQVIDQDRCHLNSLALEDGRPRYVTVLAESDEPAGWRPNKASSGCIVDVTTGKTIVRGLSMPHSVRIHNGRLWVLDSGYGRLSVVDPQSGTVTPAALLPGYTRGLCFYGPLAFVGLSKIRETNIFGGLPIGEYADKLECGVSVVDLRSGQRIAHLTFDSGVDEIYDVQVLPGVRLPAIVGPDPEADGQKHVWLAAQPAWM